MENNNEMNEKDYLNKYISDNDKINSPKINFQQPITEEKKDERRASDLHYFHFDAAIMPLGKFYPNGTTIMVRPAQVKEVQAYSMVDDNNIADIIEKMNDIVMNCVRVKHPNGEIGTFLDVKDGDRFYLVFLIRELTFQTGNVLAAKVECSCGIENSIELKRGNFLFNEIDEEIAEYFDEYEKKFIFKTATGDTWKLGVPCIGLQKAFTEIIMKDYRDKKNPNLAFLKIIPFTISDRRTIKAEDAKKMLIEFQNMDMDTFQILNAFVSKMKFGIKEAKSTCECGQEVHTDNIFPSGASGIFTISNPLGKLIRK